MLSELSTKAFKCRPAGESLMTHAKLQMFFNLLRLMLSRMKFAGKEISIGSSICPQIRLSVAGKSNQNLVLVKAIQES